MDFFDEPFSDLAELLSQLDEEALGELTMPLPLFNEHELFGSAYTRTQPQQASAVQLLPPLQSSSRFTAPLTEADVHAAQACATPKNTLRNTTWAVNIWKGWTSHHRQICSPLDCPPHLLLCTVGQLDLWLSKFILQIRKKDGQHYPPQTLCGIVCGLLRYVRDLCPAINFFSDPEFAGFRGMVDGEMKRLRSLGLRTQKKTAEPISVSEESKLRELKLLGSQTPEVLLDTMVFVWTLLCTQKWAGAPRPPAVSD